MKKYIFFLAISMVSLALSSCNREPEPILTLDGPESYLFGTDGGNFSVSVTTTYPWTVSSSESWISLSSNGAEAGTSSIEFTIAQNEDPEDREGLICFSTQNLRDTIKVTQLQKDKIAVSGQKEYTIDQKGGTLNIEVKSNVDYKVTTTSTWISRTGTKAYTAKTEVFEIQPNTKYDDREAWIIFSNNDLTDSIKVCQKQLDALIPSGENEITIPRSASTFSIAISTNITYSVSLSNSSWLRYVETKALRDENLIFSASENKSGEARTATITLTGPSDIKEVYTVTQSGQNMLKIGINAAGFISPTIRGNQLSGTINWGDGTKDDFASGILHNYTGKGSRTVSIDITGNTTVIMDNIVGVESVDISNF